MRRRAAHPRSAALRPGFTLIELLVVVGIIAVLLSIGIVAGGAALASAKRSSTERLLSSIGASLEQFKADHGYYPPLLNKQRNPAPSPADAPLVSEAQPDPFKTTDPKGAVVEARYYSILSLAAYLVGVGDINGDGIVNYAAQTTPGPNLDDGVDGPGIRSPGPDRSWGGATRRAQRLPAAAGDPLIPDQTGRVYGPYLALTNSRNLRRILPNDSRGVSGDFVWEQTALAPNGGTPSQGGRDGIELYTIVDGENTPIRYYRYLPTRETSDPTSRDTLGNIPVELLTPAGFDEFSATGGALAGGASETRLRNAPYALVSAGSDALFGESKDETIDPSQPRYLAKDLESLRTSDAAAHKKIRSRIADNVRYVP